MFSGGSKIHDLDTWSGQAEMKELPGVPYPPTAYGLFGGQHSCFNQGAPDKCMQTVLRQELSQVTAAGSPQQYFIVRKPTPARQQLQRSHLAGPS